MCQFRQMYTIKIQRAPHPAAPMLGDLMDFNDCFILITIVSGRGHCGSSEMGGSQPNPQRNWQLEKIWFKTNIDLGIIPGHDTFIQVHLTSGLRSSSRVLTNQTWPEKHVPVFCTDLNWYNILEVELTHFRGYMYNLSSYHHHQIGSINLSPCCHIGCVWGGCSIICSWFHTHTHTHIYIYIYIYIYDPMVVYGYLHIALLHYHYYTDVPECIELLKYLSDIFCVERVSDQVSSLSYLSYNIWSYVYSAYPDLLRLVWFLCLILLSSSNRKYGPFAIA